MTDKLRNRIREHRKVRLGDLVPHELNPRTHSEAQRAVLSALYEEVGFARSVLAYELPDGRLKLIDGHLRSSLTPDEIVDVEILDVNDAEARTLLLTLDPLAELATYDDAALTRLREAAEQDSAAVQGLWQTLSREDSAIKERQRQHDPPGKDFAEQYLVMVVCADEAEQVELLQRFQAEGLTCQAKIA